MTKKLFYDDSYICEAKCEVESIIEKEDKYEVVLKETPFYPEGGGQPSDLGEIDGIKVEYVHEEDDIIYHVMSQKPQNKIVSCKVDFSRRKDHIQQHSGEHLLSSAFFRLFKGVNAGFHMGDDYVTIDIDIKDISEDMLKKAEIEANDYIFRNEEVKTYVVSKEDALKLPLRKEIKVDENVRIVQMGNIDYSACCGTQVKRTGEVGLIKIIKAEKNKGMTRIYLKCGDRALKDYIKKHDLISELGRSFSTDEDEIIKKVKSQNEEIANLKKCIAEFNKKQALEEAEKLIKAAKNKCLSAIYEDKDIEFIQNIFEALKDKEYILVLASLSDKKLIFANNGNFQIDCGKIFKENLKEFNGKGGGNSKRAQAAFDDEKDLKKFVEFLCG